MSNRLIILICSVISIFLIRQEIRINTIENKLDDIIQVHDRISYTKKDLDCLTRNIYYEARGENESGKFAVGHVTVNRLKAGYWGNTICRVVYAPKQFSWTDIKKLPQPNAELYAESEQIARRVLAGYGVRGLVHGLYYHSTDIKNPKWADPEQQAGQIGNHVFYNRAKGSNLTI